MHVELSPDPSPEEHAALLRALDGLAEPTRPVSAWWEAGIREAVEEEAQRDGLGALSGESATA